VSETESIFHRRVTALVALVAVLCGFAYVFGVTFFPVPEGNVQFANIILGALIGIALATPIGYYLGSSKPTSPSEPPAHPAERSEP
jgi:hypothetical protein